MPLSEVGPYRLLRLLKEGGEGSVYIAEDPRLGRRVALKLRPLPVEQSARAAAIAEAETLASLNHPLIVQLYDLVELPETLALVMEYVDGKDLEELLSRSGPDLHAVLQIGIDICTALGVAHERGIVHGDLKPSNILVDGRGQIKLADFGIARRPGAPSGPAGSPSTLAPEQLSGEPPGVAADLFALGCLLYRLTVGRQPSAQAEGVGRQHTGFRQFGDLSVDDMYAAAPQPLASLIGQLLSREPGDRPGSAMQVRHALLAIARDYPAGASEALADRVREARRQATPADPVAGDPATRAPGQNGDSARGLWGRPWLRWFAAFAGCMALLTLLLWQPRWPAVEAPVYLMLEPLELDGYPVSAGLAPAELQELLRLEVSQHGAVSLVSGADGLALSGGSAVERLLLKVRCNPHVCSSQLVRQGKSAPRANLMAMLPDAPRADWQQRIAQGLQALFPASGHPLATD